MSAQPVWELPAGAPNKGQQRHLRLVTDADLHVAPVTAGQSQPKMRLTRRGRLSITIASTASALAIVAGLLLGGGAASATTEEVVVQPGQTLSDVAAEQLPNTRLDMAIVDLQLANNMSTDQVAVGQTLVIPAEEGFGN